MKGPWELTLVSCKEFTCMVLKFGKLEHFGFILTDYIKIYENYLKNINLR